MNTALWSSVTAQKFSTINPKDSCPFLPQEHVSHGVFCGMTVFTVKLSSDKISNSSSKSLKAGSTQSRVTVGFHASKIVASNANICAIVPDSWPKMSEMATHRH
jgi:hypothetical protein